MQKGYVLKDKKSTFIDEDAIIGENVIIYENNRIEGKTIVEDNVTIYPNSYIVSSIIGKGTKIYSSTIEKSKIGSCAIIGPYAHLRAGSEIADGVKIGNFCEIKNSKVGSGSKICHLAYVGDAEIGEDCNIGCGAIFVNFNGKIKQKTTVGNGSFIGSNVNVVAPVKIGEKVYICAGTTIDKDVSDGDFVIGRVRQETKSGKAKDYLK